MAKLFLISICFVLTGGFVTEIAASALQAVQDSNQAALVAQQNLTDRLEREQELYRIMDGVTDWPTLADAAVIQACRGGSAEECTSLKVVFTELLRLTAVRRLGRYQARDFAYLGEETDGATAVVKTIAHYENQEFPLDYELQHMDGQWKIVNYHADGIDTVKNYQRQFRVFLRNKSMGDLIGQLKRRIEQLDSELAP